MNRETLMFEQFERFFKVCLLSTSIALSLVTEVVGTSPSSAIVNFNASLR